jgi:hypothetical protein
MKKAVDLIPENIAYVTPDSRVAVFKKLMHNHDNGYADVLFIRDILFKQCSNLKSDAIVNAINAANSIKEITDNIIDMCNTVEDGNTLLAEIDGVLTIKFNRYLKYGTQTGITIDSFIDDIDSVVTEINDDNSKLKSILEYASTTIFNYLKTSAMLVLTNNGVSDLSVYDMSSAEDGITWLPLVTAEAQFVLKDKATVKSFLDFYKSKCTSTSGDTLWYDVIMDRFQRDNDNAFTRNRYAKVLLLDPYLQIKEFEVFFGRDNRVIITEVAH